MILVYRSYLIFSYFGSGDCWPYCCWFIFYLSKLFASCWMWSPLVGGSCWLLLCLVIVSCFVLWHSGGAFSDCGLSNGDLLVFKRLRDTSFFLLSQNYGWHFPLLRVLGISGRVWSVWLLYIIFVRDAARVLAYIFLLVLFFYFLGIIFHLVFIYFLDVVFHHFLCYQQLYCLVDDGRISSAPLGRV